ncbi:hypothetical protein Taro_049823, partial [Colocasia esculenta]|nr:hypothetical protein [Colocasia esculenta]
MASRYGLDMPEAVTKVFPSGISKEVFNAANNLIMQNSRWVLGDGKDIDILRHKWVGSASLISFLPTLSQQPFSSVKDVVVQHDHPLRSHDIISRVMENISLSDTPDACAWMCNVNGIFFTSSAFQAVRPHGINRPTLLNIWHHAFNPRASIFGWRILHRAMPTDDRLFDCGIHLASLCSCCKNPSIEDLDHLFLTGELASMLWRWASPLLSDQVMGPHITSTSWNTISMSNCQSASVKLTVPKLVRWIPPQYGFNLNVDGACKGNPGPCGGGGCFQDLNGDIHLGFNFSYGQGNNMIVEVCTLCDGIRIAKSFLSNTNIKLVHVYRETNRVADTLASFACERGGSSVFTCSSLPSVYKGP